jgi:hypothetical protein
MPRCAALSCLTHTCTNVLMVFLRRLLKQAQQTENPRQLLTINTATSASMSRSVPHAGHACIHVCLKGKKTNSLHIFCTFLRIYTRTTHACKQPKTKARMRTSQSKPDYLAKSAPWHVFICTSPHVFLRCAGQEGNKHARVRKRGMRAKILRTLSRHTPQ